MQVNVNLPLGGLPFRTLVGDLLPSSSSSHSHAGPSSTALTSQRAWHVLASNAKVSKYTNIPVPPFQYMYWFPQGMLCM